MQPLPRPMVAPTTVQPPCTRHGSCLESETRCIERNLSTCQLPNHQKMPRPADEAMCGVFTIFLLLRDGGLGLEHSVTCSALGAEQQANTALEYMQDIHVRTADWRDSIRPFPGRRSTSASDGCADLSQIARSRSAGRIQTSSDVDLRGHGG